MRSSIPNSRSRSKHYFIGATGRMRRTAWLKSETYTLPVPSAASATGSPATSVRVAGYPAGTRAGPLLPPLLEYKRCVLLGYTPGSHPQPDQQPQRNHQIHAQEHQANRAFLVELEPHEDPCPSQREETQ
jgi:hypothetical protein